jgi:uracil-DNA glycosylase
MVDWISLCGREWAEKLRPTLDDQDWAQLNTFVEECSSDDNVKPPPHSICAALRLTPPGEVRVVIVGQDPYPTDGQANGLAFAVSGSTVPQTLKNIFKELNCDVCVPIPNGGNLEPWARRGVLLLNATLTFREGDSARHRLMWKPFTDSVIRIAEESDPVFILWGRVAQEKVLALIDQNRRMVIMSPHPAQRSARTGFFGSKPFSRTNQALISATGRGIDWTL